MRAWIGLASLGIAASACTLPFDEGAPGCESFSDDFEDGVRADFWLPNSFETPPTTLREVGGELVFSIADGEPGSPFSGYLSDELDFTNRSTRIRVLEIPNAATNAQAIFKLEIPYPYVAMLMVEAGQLRARLEIEGFFGDLMAVPYDSGAHRFFRLRHRDDVLYFDTSPDGSDWATLATRAMLPVTNARIGVLAGTYQPETAPGSARFDDFVAACR